MLILGNSIQFLNHAKNNRYIFYIQETDMKREEA